MRAVDALTLEQRLLVLISPLLLPRAIPVQVTRTPIRRGPLCNANGARMRHLVAQIPLCCHAFHFIAACHDA